MTAGAILTNDNRSPAEQVSRLLACLLGLQIVLLQRAEKARGEARGLPAGEELAVLTERAAILEDAASAICGVTRIAKEIAEDLIEAEGELCERGCGEPKHPHRTKERLLARTSASEGASP